MLIRFKLKNLFSFKEETEFNLLPGRIKRLDHHKYERNGIEILKLSAIYGANGSGKSNLIRSLTLLKYLMLNGAIQAPLLNQKFRLSKTSQAEPVELALEFHVGQSTYYYSVSINDGVIEDEYFCSTGPNQEDVLIFHRVTDNSKNTIRFSKAFENDPDNQTLKRVIETDLLKPHQPLFNLLTTITNSAFNDVQIARQWVEKRLVIISTGTKPNSLAHQLDSKKGFQEFANNLLCSLSTGISAIQVETKSLEAFFGDDNDNEIEEIKVEAKNNPDVVILRRLRKDNDEFTIVNQGGKLVVKSLFLEHRGEHNENIRFKLNEESDGTRRLLDYLPAWEELLDSDTTFVIDEIERSIHPLIIKELIEKFSKDIATKGQLIFSTHESTLLDQDIFRTDEIWFAEKNQQGATKLYSLSDFKEHNTIDIRKGYLTGRYGAIPFLGNLHDLNWHTPPDETK